MKTLEDMIDAALANPLGEVFAGAAAIGCVGTDIPIDLLLASGRPFAHLPWRAERPTPKADAWIESRFPVWAKSILQDWAQGRFDGFRDVVFSRGNDASQRLYYYVCELQRVGRLGGPAPSIFDVAYVQRDSSLRHTVAAVHRLAQRLDVDSSSLGAGIQRANLWRDCVARVEVDSTIHGVLYGKLTRVSLYRDVTRLLGAHPPPQSTPSAGLRVLLAGSLPPSERLHEVVSSSGAVVIAEWHEGALTRWGPPLNHDGGDLFADVARHIREHSLAPRRFVDAAGQLVNYAQRQRAQAVLLWLTDDDESRAWQVPAQRIALADAGIPTLVLSGRSAETDEMLAREIQTFLQGVSR
ncbi:MAG: 2-hydroxyacyl-CoA dehydratase family protein [Pseudomonadota bacterium]